MATQNEVSAYYGQRVRVRACGLCWEEDRVLMVNHRGVTRGDFWAPPGGGIDFGLSAEETVAKELLEETGLQVSVGDFLFACEQIRPPLHSVELFFAVRRTAGTLRVGNDPELPIISDVRFLSFPEIMALPPADVHGIFRHARTASSLRELRGFHRLTGNIH